MNRRSLALLACLFASVVWAQEEQHPADPAREGTGEHVEGAPEHGEPPHGAVPAHAPQAAHHDGAPEGEGHEGGEHEHDTPSVIIHHVSDDFDYEFEIPWPGAHNPVLHLGEIFKGLVWEREPGVSCGLPAPKGMDATPSFGTFFTNGCYDFRPTKVLLMMWISVALLLFLIWRFAHTDHTKLVPHGVGANIIEVLLLFVRDEIAVKNVGKEEAERYTPFLASIFFFILTMNWLGLIPNFASATGNLAVTVSLAACTFVLTQAASIRSAGVGGYLKHLTAGTPVLLWPIMIPVEVLSLFTKPFALTVRLFANMLAGHMVLFFMLGLIFMLHPALAFVSVPMATGVFFLEIFVGILQAYIFTLLSGLFIGLGVAMGHHDHDGHDGHDHAPETIPTP